MNQGERELLRQVVAENIKMAARYENILNELDNLWTSFRELQDSHDNFYERAMAFHGEAMKQDPDWVKIVEALEALRTLKALEKP